MSLQVFPSYLSPDNAALPYAAVHVEETNALQAVPSRGRRTEHDQLSSDRVKVTLYGATARKAADFYDFVLQYMRDAGKLVDAEPSGDARRALQAGRVSGPGAEEDHRLRGLLFAERG